MKFLILALIAVSVIPAFGAYSDIPAEPEVHFKAFVPPYAFIQKDFSFQLTAVDDRSSYSRAAPAPSQLHDATVTAIIHPSWSSQVIEEITGKTSKRGYFAGNDFIKSQDYKNHGLYNMTITVEYGESSETQHFQFWTTLKQH